MISKLPNDNMNFQATYRFSGGMPKQIKKIFRKQDILPSNYNVSMHVFEPQKWNDKGTVNVTNPVSVRVRKDGGIFVAEGLFSVVNKNFVSFYMKVNEFFSSLV